MQLHLDAMGFIPSTYPRKFYRVSTWETERRVADFTTHSEAYAASMASKHGGKFDHKVSEMNIG